MELGFRAFCAITCALRWLLAPLFFWRSLRKFTILPAIGEPLLEISATNLARKIRKKENTSEEIVRAYIKRIQAVNPKINAVVEERFSEAIEDAKKVDEYLQKGLMSEKELKLNKPLLGVPVTIKESCGLEGLSYEGGSLAFKGRKAERDGEAVARLKKAGAIPLLVSNTPELCFSWECRNLTTGTTRNPYDLNRTAGGSSGGEGALLGAGASILGVGSDIGGSIRFPAMFNGIFGHKPSPGMVPLDGHYPMSPDPSFHNYLTIGPMARYAEDLHLGLQVLVGKNSSEVLLLHEDVDLSKVTIFFMTEARSSAFTEPVSDEIKQVMQNAVKHLRNVSHSTVSDLKFVELCDTVEMCMALYSGVNEVPYILGDGPKKHNLAVELVKSLFGRSKFTLSLLGMYTMLHTNFFIRRSNYEKYVGKSRIIRRHLISKLRTTGVLLFPTFPSSAFVHGQSLCDPSAIGYATIANVFGFPSTHVPLGMDKNGLPIGIQVIAAPNQDRLCLAIAAELEKGFGGWILPENRMYL